MARKVLGVPLCCHGSHALTFRCTKCEKSLIWILMKCFCPRQNCRSERRTNNDIYYPIKLFSHLIYLNNSARTLRDVLGRKTARMAPIIGNGRHTYRLADKTRRAATSCRGHLCAILPPHELAHMLSCQYCECGREARPSGRRRMCLKGPSVERVGSRSPRARASNESARVPRARTPNESVCVAAIRGPTRWTRRITRRREPAHQGSGAYGRASPRA